MRRTFLDRDRSGAGTLITNISLGGKPEYGASAGDGKVYANLTDTSETVEIDAKAATVGCCAGVLGQHSLEIAKPPRRRCRAIA
jgi:Na+/glutamate symporter